jgi:phosphoribosylamine--glycine ligase
MKILLLGNGGREHALAWKMSQSAECEKIYIAPGNAGTSLVGENVALNPIDFESISKFIKNKAIDLVLVGPEMPLVKGIIDFLELVHPEVILVGPSKAGAQLEGSKAFAKDFMKEFGIPTANYIEITSKNIIEGIKHIEGSKGPYVLKADGLAGGKGVLILEDTAEAIRELNNMLGGKFGEAGKKVVIEEFLSGMEFSVFVLTDGRDYVILPEAKDYKRIGEGDQGLNTGGMGAISPVPFVDGKLMQKVKTRIIGPTIKGIQSRKLDYKGFIFFGLIEVNNEPYVIEYNCRMGDPETQVVIPRLKNDILRLFICLKDGSLSEQTIEVHKECGATIVCASGGYPEAYQNGFEIQGLQTVNESMVFHAGTKRDGNRIVTSGGRVLAVTSLAQNKNEALQQSLNAILKLSFKDMYYRRDIGFDLS